MVNHFIGGFIFINKVAEIHGMNKIMREKERYIKSLEEEFKETE